MMHVFRLWEKWGLEMKYTDDQLSAEKEPYRCYVCFKNVDEEE